METTTKNSILATGLTIIVLGLAGWWWLSGSVSLAPAGPIETESKEIAESSSEDNYAIKVKYPAISSGSELRDHRINTDLEKQAQKIISDFKKDKAEFETLTSSNGDIPVLVTTPYSLDSSFVTTKNTKNIFGVAFYVSSYMAGAAHPNNYLITANYDLTTGLPIDIADIFVDDSDYLTVLSEKSREILYKQLAKDLPYIQDQIDAGTNPKLINFEAFLVEQTGLRILFSPYQIGPYALGSVEITIPWSELELITNI